MRCLCTIVGLISATFFASALHAETPLAAPPTLLVVNQTDHDLSLIDPKSNHEVSHVDVGGITGHEVVATPDGRTAFVPHLRQYRRRQAGDRRQQDRRH